MKIVSWNVNGLRAVVKKGFLEWIRKENPEILCLQEIKIQESEIPFDLIYLDSYNGYFNSSSKRGYSGVAVYSKKKGVLISNKIGNSRFDTEGRFIHLEFPDFNLLNIYVPHGSRDKHNLDYKLVVYHQLLNYLKSLESKKIILLGDFNVAHEEIDLARPNENRDNIMFTPSERFQIDRVIHLGFVDTYRRFNKDSGHYTWWSYMRNARERNLGWRIDYTFVSEILSFKVKEAFILKDGSLGSDHSPIGIEF